MRKNVMSYANNKGADQPAHPHSLISAFVIRCLDSIISLDSIAEDSFKTLASYCGCAGRVVSGLVGNSRRHVLTCRGSLNNRNLILSTDLVIYNFFSACVVLFCSKDLFKYGHADDEFALYVTCR